MSDKPWEFGHGGVAAECPNKIPNIGKGKGMRCGCGKCAVCGFSLHSSVHMHVLGGKPGEMPYDHRFVPRTKP